LVDKKVISEADVDLMDISTRERLVNSDPVTCARYFRHSMDSLLTFICSCSEIIGEMEDFFLRDEFQQREFPHSHWLAFIKDAPVYGRVPDQVICDFVDKYIWCHRDPLMVSELIKLQEHRHSGCCCRRESGCLPHCRFCYPQPPMQTTKILTPLPDDMPKEESKAHRKKWNTIFERLKEIDQAKELLDIELVDFLADKKLTEEEYLLALRSSLTRPTLFLARRLSEMRMYFYNKEIFEMTRANMDIQFCLDPYAAATYVASYMMKGQRGMSKAAMSAACSEARAGNPGIKEIVCHMENVFSRASEVSAQEAVYHSLGLPFKRSSRACKFVPTSPPADHTFIARQDRDLKKLDDESTDIAYPSLVDKYANRPSKLHPLSLAEFVAWYEPIRPATVAPEEVNDDNHDADEDMFFPSETVANPGVHIVEEDGVEAPAYKNRKCVKIIRYVRYSLASATTIIESSFCCFTPGTQRTSCNLKTSMLLKMTSC
jgi:hypothetical protein